jgi:hypothetical protein
MKKGRLESRPFLVSNFSRTEPALSEAEGSVRPHYGFFGAIASFAALATRNFTTVFALI